MRCSLGTTARWTAFVLVSSLLLAVASFPRRASAQFSVPSLYDVQSVYLFDFAKFVRWPTGADKESLTFCVAGQKIYRDELTKVVAGEHVDAHPLAVRAIEGPKDEAGCSILFIDSSELEQLDGFLAASVGKPVLTVSDIPDFLERGGMIQFLVMDKRVRFSVDLRPVESSGISLDSELLKVAVSVAGNPGGGKP